MNGASQQACVVFNKLIVNYISQASGIFIGTNQAIGWRSYRKSNEGLGNVRDSTVVDTINVVNDQDVVDMPIKDSSTVHMQEGGGQGQRSAIAFRSINAVAVANTSAIDVGDIMQPAWRSAHKNNYGTGTSVGVNQISHVANLIRDNDVVDTASVQESK